MPTVPELYELWATESELDDDLSHSFDPRGVEWLFEVFARLGPRPGELLVDAGARDARHAIRLVRDHGVRAVALDPVPRHLELARAAVKEAGVDDAVEVVEAWMEEMPLADGSADWIWCRDVLVHVDAAAALAEAARVLRPGGRLLAYVTLATERLEPREREEIFRAVAVRPDSADGAELERLAADSGLVLNSVEPLGTEWRERMIEDATWSPSEDLLRLARLRRRESELVERYGRAAVEAYTGGALWGIYQLLGKLCPTIYVWERRA